jgi:hypothetical protein
MVSFMEQNPTSPSFAMTQAAEILAGQLVDQVRNLCVMSCQDHRLLPLVGWKGVCGCVCVCIWGRGVGNSRRHFSGDSEFLLLVHIVNGIGPGWRTWLFPWGFILFSAFYPEPCFSGCTVACHDVDQGEEGVNVCFTLI